MAELDEITEIVVQGLVAQVINARELVITVGSEHGVKRGMKFAVLAAAPLEIRDPQTGEVLDLIDREKIRVEATRVRPRISICQTYRKRITPAGAMYNVGRLGFGLEDMWRPPREEVETLRAGEHAYPEPLAEKDSYVKIGDRVVEIVDDRNN